MEKIISQHDKPDELRKILNYNLKYLKHFKY